MYVGELNSGDSTTRGTWGQQTSETGRSLTRRSPPEHLMEGGMQPFRMGGAEFSLERRATKNHSLQCPNRNAICGWAAAEASTFGTVTWVAGDILLDSSSRGGGWWPA
jgi:hypothetical protein